MSKLAESHVLRPDLPQSADVLIFVLIPVSSQKTVDLCMQFGNNVTSQ